MNRLINYLGQTPPLKLALAWTVTIIALLSIPGRDIPEIGPAGLDKPVHAFLFIVFTFLWARSFKFNLLKSVGLAFVLGFIFAIASELYQGILPFERTLDKYDVIANWTGTVIGCIISVYALGDSHSKLET
ncbi:MAG: VanZ family protein [Rhodothermales bacterium]|nr:VanZ family protein [Rhodothermales bacterium]